MKEKFSMKYKISRSKIRVIIYCLLGCPVRTECGEHQLPPFKDPRGRFLRTSQILALSYINWYLGWWISQNSHSGHPPRASVEPWRAPSSFCRFPPKWEYHTPSSPIAAFDHIPRLELQCCSGFVLECLSVKRLSQYIIC